MHFHGLCRLETGSLLHIPFLSHSSTRRGVRGVDPTSGRGKPTILCTGHFSETSSPAGPILTLTTPVPSARNYHETTDPCRYRRSNSCLRLHALLHLTR